MTTFTELQQKFKNPQLLVQALTHRSYAHENNKKDVSNERLEFLGDAILNLISAEYLYETYPDLQEDEMSRRRSALVDEKQLADFADQLGIVFFMRLGEGAKREGGFANRNLLSSAFESVVAAYYLDQNKDINEVKKFVIPLFQSVSYNRIEIRSNVDSKNRLQAYSQSKLGGIQPEYKTIQSGGTDHSPQFTSKVYVEDKLLGQGKARTKKEAEKMAAENALMSLEKQGLL